MEALFHVLKPWGPMPFVPCPAALSSVLQLYNSQIYGKKNVKNWVRLVNPCNTTHWQTTCFQRDLLCSCRVLVQNELYCGYLQGLRTNHKSLGLATTDSEKNENIYLNLSVSSPVELIALFIDLNSRRLALPHLRFASKHCWCSRECDFHEWRFCFAGRF